MNRVISHVVHPDLGDFSLEADETGDFGIYHTLDPEQPEKKTRMDMSLSVLFGLTHGAMRLLGIGSVAEAHHHDQALRRLANVRAIPIRRTPPVVAVPIIGRVS